MNYYPHHIGDYVTATAHLSMTEDGAYRRLLDLYYSRESSIPADLVQICRLARALTREERKAVETVLREFFTETSEGWSHKRCDTEIAKARVAAEKARENGKKGGRPRREEPSDNPAETQQVISGLAKHNPDESEGKAPNPKNQEPNTSEAKASGGKPPVTDPNEIIFGYGVPLLTNAGTPEKQARSFLGGLRKSHGDESLIDKLRECLRAKPLQPLEWLAAALPPPEAAPRSNGRTPALDGFATKDYGIGGAL